MGVCGPGLRGVGGHRLGLLVAAVDVASVDGGGGGDVGSLPAVSEDTDAEVARDVDEE